MAAKRVLVDTNVAIDWLIDHKPWSDDAVPLWASQDAGQTELCLPVSVLDTIYYVIRKGKDFAIAKHAIERCITTLTILPMDISIVQPALALPGNDFEDNLLVACAVGNGLDLIVTRDPAGFKNSLVPAINPTQVSAYLAAANL